jgi:alpha-tubulin suppressor-like RCC1 family protein
VDAQWPAHTSLDPLAAANAVRLYAAGNLRCVRRHSDRSGLGRLYTCMSPPRPPAPPDVDPGSLAHQIVRHHRFGGFGGHEPMSKIASREAVIVRFSRSNRGALGTQCRLVLLFALVPGCSGDGGPMMTNPEPVAAVIVAPNASILVVGETRRLTATLHDAAGNVLDGRAITWQSSDNAIVSVGTAGLVRAVAQGQATITATSEGKSGTADVSVSVFSFVAVATGGAHTCALTANGAAYCWGRDEAGQLGIPSPTSTCLALGLSCSMAPVPVQGGIHFIRLTAGGAHTCGLASDGTAYCWGANSNGQLGDGSIISRNTPVRVSTTFKFSSINAGEAHTCGLTSNGSALCWGRNDGGQLGDNTTTARSVPTPVAIGLAVRVIDAGGYGGPIDNPFPGFTCALSNAGDAYCWGENAFGNLGRGTSSFPQPSPALVSGGLKFGGLTVGLDDHACAVTPSGQAYCWGANFKGSLGEGTSTERDAPVPVSGGLTFVQLAAGGYNGHTCRRTGAGVAYCWGDNEVGQVGDGTTVVRLTPTAVTGGLIFTSLDSGYRHTCGMASTSVVYCWGSNGAGQLGNNSMSASSVPVRVLGQADPSAPDHSGRARLRR